MYRSTKTFPPMSCAFRQHAAKSHCKYIHGYGLTFKLTFVSETLDVNNWVIDFGALKELKNEFEEMFDHKMLVASDDPAKTILWSLASQHWLAQVKIVDHTGCEAFAKMGGLMTQRWLEDNGHSGRVNLETCEVWEHASNSASWSPVNDD